MSLSVSIVIAILVLCLASEVAPASPSSSLSRCPFTINSTNGTITINRTDELKRRDVTPEQFDEHLAALVWCLPKTYNMEKPPFVGEKYESLRSKGDFPTINCNSIFSLKHSYYTVPPLSTFSCARILPRLLLGCRLISNVDLQVLKLLARNKFHALRIKIVPPKYRG